jgi:hypothetical protein
VSRSHFSSHRRLIVAVQYDGEKDVRGPRDFSGKTSGPLDDVKDGDDDDGDEEDDRSRLRVGEKRSADGRAKGGEGNGNASNGSVVPSEVRSWNPFNNIRC